MSALELAERLKKRKGWRLEGSYDANRAEILECS